MLRGGGVLRGLRDLREYTGPFAKKTWTDKVVVSPGRDETASCHVVSTVVVVVAHAQLSCEPCLCLLFCHAKRLFSHKVEAIATYRFMPKQDAKLLFSTTHMCLIELRRVSFHVVFFEQDCARILHVLLLTAARLRTSAHGHHRKLLLQLGLPLMKLLLSPFSRPDKLPALGNLTTSVQHEERVSILRILLQRQILVDAKDFVATTQVSHSKTQTRVEAKAFFLLFQCFVFFEIIVATVTETTSGRKTTCFILYLQIFFTIFFVFKHFRLIAKKTYLLNHLKLYRILNDNDANNSKE